MYAPSMKHTYTSPDGKIEATVEPYYNVFTVNVFDPTENVILSGGRMFKTFIEACQYALELTSGL